MGNQETRCSLYHVEMWTLANPWVQERIEIAECVASRLHPVGSEYQARDLDRAISNARGSQR